MEVEAMGDAEAGSSNEQQIWVNGTDTPHPISFTATASESLSSSRSAITLKLDCGADLAEIQSKMAVRSKREQLVSSGDLLLRDRRASPQPPKQQVRPLRKIPAYVTEAVHEYTLDQVRKLRLELASAREHIERVEKAIRDLAMWTYNERKRLLRELAEAKSVRVYKNQTEMEAGECSLVCQSEQMTGFEPSLFIDAQVEQLIAEEKDRLGSM